MREELVDMPMSSSEPLQPQYRALVPDFFAWLEK